jgi:hypothetical protein
MTDKQKIEQVLSEVDKILLPNGKWHVKRDLSLCSKNLTSLKDLNVEIVDGSFDCSYNSLTSLEGAPKEVGESFWCHYNSITTLTGAPREVRGNFWCDHNKLTSLEGALREVGGSFICNNNDLTSLKGTEKIIVKGDFFCYNNDLTSLEGAPREVGGNFYCDNTFTETDEYKELIKTYEIINALNSL